jgi:anti-sigma B factor antagonist
MNDPVRTDENLPLPGAEHRIQVALDEVGDTIVVRASGEIDMLTAQVLHEHVSPCLVESGRLVLLDLTGVGFLGSAGLAELVATRDVASRNGVRLRLVANSRVVLRPLEVTGLLELFEVFATVDAARNESLEEGT